MDVDLKGICQKKIYSIDLAVMPCLGAKAILVNYPGYGGQRDGYNNKYITMGNLLVEKKLAAFASLSNKPLSNFSYAHLLTSRLERVIAYVIEHALELTGGTEPEIWLWGTSAGGSAVAAVAYKYPNVTKILLLAPSTDAGAQSVIRGLAQFSGEVFITVGEKDDVVGPGVGKWCYDAARGARAKSLVLIPECDHQFRGSNNGRILSQAPFWAFDNFSPFPDPLGGVDLY